MPTMNLDYWSHLVNILRCQFRLEFGLASNSKDRLLKCDCCHFSSQFFLVYKYTLYTILLLTFSLYLTKMVYSWGIALLTSCLSLIWADLAWICACEQLYFLLSLQTLSLYLKNESDSWDIPLFVFSCYQFRHFRREVCAHVHRHFLALLNTLSPSFRDWLQHQWQKAMSRSDLYNFKLAIAIFVWTLLV